jgi:hypothetical protein
MNLVVKEKIDVMKKRLTNLSKIDPDDCDGVDEQEEAQEVIASIEEAWKSILGEYDFGEE